MNLLPNFHLAVIEHLYRGRRAVPLQSFTTRHKRAVINALHFRISFILKNCRRNDLSVVTVLAVTVLVVTVLTVSL